MFTQWPNLCDPDNVLSILMTIESAVKIAWHSWNKDNLLQNRRSSRCTGWRKYLKRKDIIRGIRWHWRMFSKELSHHPFLWFLQMLLELILMMSDFTWALSADQQVFSLNKVSSCLFLLSFFHWAQCLLPFWSKIAKSKFS